MLRICYMSRASHFQDEAAMRDLLHQASARNEQDGITGLLLYDGTRFLQAIEGPSEATAACYGRIHNDPRHHRIRLLAQEDIGTREFGDWSMTYRRASDADAATFLDTVLADVRRVEDAYLQMLFAGFAARRAGCGATTPEAA